MKIDFITLCDGYKLDHRRQYPDGTTSVYSNWTARSSRVEGQKEVVLFGLQYFLDEYLGRLANVTFFNKPVKPILEKYQRRLDSYFGPNPIGTEHIRELHKLGYIPLEFKSLPEGTRVPLRVPMFTSESTHPDFFWVTNYLESLMSAILWKPCTSATTAYRIRKMLDGHAAQSGDPAFVDWQGHDFSFRGMSGVEDAVMSGAGHLLSFTGTDTVPALDFLDEYYGTEDSLIVGGSVPATEHSVMCAGGCGEGQEIETYRRIISLYPQGIVSIVSDTWDLWEVVNFLPRLKRQIMARNGKVVIRPDSGDPAKIICGDITVPPITTRNEMIHKGLIECLWDIFGGTINKKGYKELDPHIGAIYGDSINYERADDICLRLEAKGFASTSVVFGLGSYTYEYTTRDTYGFAMKATGDTINGVEHAIFKDPKTDDGIKKSLKGRIVVLSDLSVIDDLNKEQQDSYGSEDHQLKLVWRNGVFYKKYNLEGLRANIRK